jgi:hypothetical protein
MQTYLLAINKKTGPKTGFFVDFKLFSQKFKPSLFSNKKTY